MSKYPQNTKRKQELLPPINEEEEPECLIIPGLGGRGSGTTDLILIPCGSIDGCILYVESRDPHVLGVSGQVQGQRSDV